MTTLRLPVHRIHLTAEEKKLIKFAQQHSEIEVIVASNPINDLSKYNYVLLIDYSEFNLKTEGEIKELEKKLFPDRESKLIMSSINPSSLIEPQIHGMAIYQRKFDSNINLSKY